MRNFLYIICLFFSLFIVAQQQDKVDFIRGEVLIEPMLKEKQIKGTVTYEFDVLEKVDSVFLDARKIQFSSVLLNYKKAKFTTDGEVISIKKKFKKGKTYLLTLTYIAKPKQTVYFIDALGITENSQNMVIERNQNKNQIWTQGQGKYTSHWLPSFDDMNEKVEFDLNITFDKNYEVIANGKLIGTQNISESTRMWNFDMDKPMSSYLLAFAIGNYKKKNEISESGISLEMYYYPEDSLQVEPTYRYTKQIFNFLENEIGEPYPWKNYKQIPVKDFLYAGMENTGTTIFSDGYMIDSIAFIDKNYVNVNAHELAHQWFGNLVTEVDGNHHWLHEGFATYYALLAEKKIFGDDCFYWKLYDTAKQLQEISNDEKGEALINPKASSLTFYEKGSWALFMLREQIGEEAFKTGIQNYLKKHQFKNVTIADFLLEMQNTSHEDMSAYKDLWLEEKEFPFIEAIEVLKKSSISITKFLKLKQELTTSSESNESIIQRYWVATLSIELKKHILLNYYSSLSENFIENALETEGIEIRQIIGYKIGKMPINIKPKIESLLDDKSYYTIESALYKLWIYFPSDRKKYLEQTKGIVGLPNKNVKLLWLTLASITSDYDGTIRSNYKTELQSYTASAYSYEVRQGAFQYIDEIAAWSDQNLLDLVNASMHHSWQFKKFARSLLDKLLIDDNYKYRLVNLKEKLNTEETRYINSKLHKE